MQIADARLKSFQDADPEGYEVLYAEVKTDLAARYPDAAAWKAAILDNTIRARMARRLAEGQAKQG